MNPKGNFPRSWTRHVISVLALVLIGAFLLAADTNTTRRHSSQQSVTTLNTISQNYLGALSTADRFLANWLDYDMKGASALLSPSIRHHTTHTQLGSYFNNTGSPFHAGYEILGSKEIESTWYQFSVWMYGYAMGLTGPIWKRQSPRILNVRMIQGTWYISNLPRY